jgi:tetratricopeptide (TPR) repeat protein
LYRERRTGEALVQWREFLRLRPRDIAMLNQAAWILATAPEASVRSGAEAVELAQRAAGLSNGQDAAILDTLAAACAEAGRFTEAIQTAQQAIAIAMRQQNTALAGKIRARLRLYQARLPCHQSAGGND